MKAYPRMNARPILTALRNLALGVGLVFCAIAGKAGGATIQNASLRPAHEALGAQQEEVVWLEGTFGGVTYHASGILIRGATADWVLTAAHAVTGPLGTVDMANLTIGNGTSYLNDRGQTSGVASWILTPEAQASSTQSKPYGDIVYLQLTNRISNPTLYFSRAAATPSFDQQLLFTGFGEPISRAEGVLPITGNVMGFTAVFSTSRPSSYNSALYASGQDEWNSAGDGVGSQGDSGGSVKVWNPTTARYDLVGMTVSGNSSATFFYNFNEPSFTDILTNTIKPVTDPIASPALTCTVASGQAELAMSNLVTNRAYRLMRSGTLAAGSWTQAHSFTATAPTATWSEPVAPEGRQFYRLEWTE